MSNINRCCFVVMLLAYAASKPLSAPAATPAIYNLGTLGGATSRGWEINASGWVVGESDTAGGGVHAFLYAPTPGGGGSLMDLGTLGGTTSYAFAINALGQIAGA